MVYTIIKDNVSYDLPPFTISVSEAMDKINAQNMNPNANKKTNYQGMIDFIVSEVGEENAREILGGTDVTEVDLQDVSVCYLEICKAYDKPLKDAQQAEMKESMNSDELKMVVEILKNADNMEKLQKIAQKNTAKANFKNMQR